MTDAIARPTSESRRSLREVVVRDLLRDRWRLGGAIVAVLLSGAVVTAGPLVMRYGIDQGIDDGDRAALRIAVALSATLLLLGGVIGGVRTLLMANVGQGFLHDLRHRALAGILRLDLDMYEATPRGDLQARMSSDLESLSSAAEVLIPDVVRDLVLVIGGLVALGLLAPSLLVLALLAIPPSVIAGRWLLRRSQIVYPALLETNGGALGKLTEIVHGAPTIAGLRAGGRQLARLRSLDGRLVDAGLAAATMRNWFYGSLLVIQSFGTAAVVVGAGLLADGGRVTVGTAAAAVLALAGVYGPLSWMIGRLDQVLSARAALTRVVELTDVRVPLDVGTRLPARGVVQLDQVSYAYATVGGRRAHSLAVEGVDLTIGAGEHLALVGATGSGKSTIGRLVTGLAAPRSGIVRFGGIDLAQAGEAERRERLLLVPQETFLASGTIADNARLPHPLVTDDEIEAAVDRLELRQWIDSLAHGILTDVGPAGERLSAGERQLVTLLRVALSDPAVVVLDEATSVLDDATESAVATSIARLSQGRTLIVIAHRRRTAARCDRVAVLDGGHIIQIGTDAELGSVEGAYQRLWSNSGVEERADTSIDETP